MADGSDFFDGVSKDTFFLTDALRAYSNGVSGQCSCVPPYTVEEYTRQHLPKVDRCVLVFNNTKRSNGYCAR